MKNKKLATGAALFIIFSLGAGSTFALWGEEGTMDGATITAGNMDISVGATAWYDASAPAGAKVDFSNVSLADIAQERPVTSANVRKVPGDTLVAVTPVSLELEGDNLHVETGLNTNGVNTGTLFDPQYVTVETLLYNSQTGTLASTTGVTQFVTPEFVANHGLPTGAVEYDPSDPDTYTIVTTIHFAANTPDSVLEEAEGIIGNSSVYVRQMRGTNIAPPSNGQSSVAFADMTPYDYTVVPGATVAVYSWPAYPGAVEYEVDWFSDKSSGGKENVSTNEFYANKVDIDEEISLSVTPLDANGVALASPSPASVGKFSVVGSYPVEAELGQTNINAPSWIPFGLPEETGPGQSTYTVIDGYAVTSVEATITKVDGKAVIKNQITLSDGRVLTPKEVTYRTLGATQKYVSAGTPGAEITSDTLAGDVTGIWSTADYYDGNKRIVRVVNIQNL